MEARSLTIDQIAIRKIGKYLPGSTPDSFSPIFSAPSVRWNGTALGSASITKLLIPLLALPSESLSIARGRRPVPSAPGGRIANRGQAGIRRSASADVLIQKPMTVPSASAT
ncbi:hypothetical protein C7H84_22335 [Burkholderia sp. Nafp2/4-1b]|nr:hypothetical protein C7H84_22335 [Burkholderia sp. Nafp2/4-1b]